MRDEPMGPRKRRGRPYASSVNDGKTKRKLRDAGQAPMAHSKKRRRRPSS